MPLSLSTPALLFGAISLLLLAYTNRFLALASLIRSLHDRYHDVHDEVTRLQIAQLRRRVRLIRNMQALGVTSFLLCVLCMFVLFFGAVRAGQAIFGLSLVLLMASLALSAREIQLSVGALDLLLADLELRPDDARAVPSGAAVRRAPLGDEPPPAP